MIPNYSQPPAHRAQCGGVYPPAPYPYLYSSSNYPPSSLQGPHPNSGATTFSLVDTTRLPTGMSVQDAIAISDFDRLVRHQDFDKILSTAAKIKTLQNGSSASAQPSIMNLAMSNLHSKKAAKVVRDNVCDSSSADVIPRGLFPHTDTLVDEAIDSLTQEFDRCLSVQSSSSGSSSSGTDDEYLPSPKKARQKKGRDSPSQSIAVKYSKRQTDILTEWMITNRAHPFPDQIQIKALSEAAGLTYSQVVNWTTNVRKRNLKATVEHGKKPHHFLDFLFLADDREKRMLGEPYKGAPSVTSSIAKKVGKSAPKRQTKSKAKPKPQARSKSAPKPRGTTIAKPAPVEHKAMPQCAFQPPFAHGGLPFPPHQLPPPLPRGVAPYPNAVAGRPQYPPIPYGRNAHQPHAPYPGYPPYYMPHHVASGPPYPQAPPAASAYPLPAATDARTISPADSPSHVQTDAAKYGDVQATVTPDGRRNTGDSLDEALNFWNSDLFSADDISNDAVLNGGNVPVGHPGQRASIDEIESAAILKATEGGLVSTPPREDEDNDLWLGSGEDSVLNALSGDPNGAFKRSSITEAAMLPLARNEKARRMSELRLSVAPQSAQGYEYTEWLSSGGGQQSKRMSLTDEQVAEAMATPLPLDDDGLVREFLEENLAVGV